MRVALDRTRPQSETDPGHDGTSRSRRPLTFTGTYSKTKKPMCARPTACSFGCLAAKEDSAMPGDDDGNKIIAFPTTAEERKALRKARAKCRAAKARQLVHRRGGKRCPVHQWRRCRLCRPDRWAIARPGQFARNNFATNTFSYLRAPTRAADRGRHHTGRGSRAEPEEARRQRRDR